MADVAADGDEGSGVSPIVLDWEKVQWVKERGGQGALVLFRSQAHDDLVRKDVLSNSEIIAPILKHLGILVNAGSVYEL